MLLVVTKCVLEFVATVSRPLVAEKLLNFCDSLDPRFMPSPDIANPLEASRTL